MKKSTRKQPTAMLVVGGQSKETIETAAEAILKILKVPTHEGGTYQEALRALQGLAKAPGQVTISNCSFEHKA